MGYQTGQNDPDWFDVLRPTKLPAFENEFGEDGRFFAGVRQSRFGVQGLHAHRHGRAQDHLRVRAVRHRRGRGTDDVPAAPRLGRAGRRSAPARPGARSWTPTSSRTRSSTGDRTAWCSSATCRCAGRPWQDGDSRFTVALERPGRQRRPGRLRRPHRARGRQGPLPAARPLGALPHGAATGATSRSPASCGRSSGTTSTTTRSTSRRRHGLGHQPQLEHQAHGQEARGPRLSVRLRRGHPELHERRAGGRRHREQPRRTRARPSPARRCPSSASSPSSTTTGARSGRARSATRCVDIDNSDGQSADAFKTGQYALANLLYYPAPNVIWGPRSSGASARTSATASPRTTSASSSRPSTTSSSRWEASDERTQDCLVGRRLCAAAALRARPDARPRPGRRPPAEIEAALKAAYAKYKDLKEGKNADYIPALAKVDSNIYGIALVTVDGKVYTAGDIKSEVSIQSISKVFTMAKVIEEQGPDAIEKNIGVDATGHALQLHRRRRVRAEGAGRAGDEPAGEPRRHHRHQHGQGRDAATRSGTGSSASTPTSPAGRSRSTRRSSSPRATPTSATRRSRC